MRLFCRPVGPRPPSAPPNAAFPLAGHGRRRRGAAAPAAHLLAAVVQAAGGLLHRHAAEQAVAAQRVAGALPAGAEHALARARARPLRPARRQPGRPEEAPGEDKEQPAVKGGEGVAPPKPRPHLTRSLKACDVAFIRPCL